MAACPTGGHDNTEGAKFCSECGTRLEAPAAPERCARPPWRVDMRVALGTWLKDWNPDEAERVIDEAPGIAQAKGASALVDRARRALE